MLALLFLKASKLFFFSSFAVGFFQSSHFDLLPDYFGLQVRECKAQEKEKVACSLEPSRAWAAIQKK